MAEGTVVPCIKDQPPLSLPGFLFAMLCPRMSFDLSLPSFGPLAFPAFLYHFLLSLIFFRIYEGKHSDWHPASVSTLHPYPCLGFLEIWLQLGREGSAVLWRSFGGG
uniref:Uncharacterized protein n=1 Tax=Piliocolobus tephrosceles TaxID=591936 RepID=A0A8C9IV52_9PRIM